jgi:hypothetical protein
MGSMKLPTNYNVSLVKHVVDQKLGCLSYVDGTNLASILAKAHGGGATNGHYEAWSCFLTNCVKVWNLFYVGLASKMMWQLLHFP